MTAARRAGLVLVLAVVLAVSRSWIASVGSAQEDLPPAVLLLNVPGVSFEELLSVPEVAALTRAGGAALMSGTDGLAARYPPYPRVAATTARITAWDLSPTALGGLEGVGRTVDEILGRSEEPDVVVIVVSTTGSPAMARSKDELHPVVLARGAPGDLLGANRPAGTLTSDSTRRRGVVAGADVEATIAEVQGVEAPRAAAGSPIRIVDGPPPFELHERYLAMRRMTVPVQTGAGLYVVLGGLFALGVVVASARRSLPPPATALASAIAVSVPILAAALLAAGHLPVLSYATVVPFVVAVTVLGTAAALRPARRDVLAAPAAIGAGVIVFLLLEAALGWPAALTPFLGGSHLDGARFFGLPNVFIGLLLGASLYVAARLSPGAGFALLVAAALFAGVPFAGANLGAAVTLLAAAGLWYPLRRSGRLTWRGVAFAGTVVVLGTAAIVLAHAALPGAPTHVTAAAAAETSPWATFVRRLGIGWALVERNPFAIVPVIGVVVTLIAVVRPPAALATSLVRRPAWRDALLVILLASAVAYVANDTGPAAVGLGFGTALGGLLYVSCADRTWKMEPA